MTTHTGLECSSFFRVPDLFFLSSAWIAEFDNAYVTAEDMEGTIRDEVRFFNKEEKERISQLTDSSLDADGFVMAGGRKRIV